MFELIYKVEHYTVIIVHIIAQNLYSTPCSSCCSMALSAWQPWGNKKVYECYFSFM